MSNGNRDVSLVIRARNEASRALDSVSKALETLRGSQDRAARGSQATGSQLEQLGDALGKLRQQLGGENGLDRLTSSTERATAAVARLEQSTQQAVADQQRLSAQITKTEATVARLTDRQNRLTQALNQQQTATQRAQRDFASLSREVTLSERALEKSGAQSQRYIDQIVRQSAALERTQSQYRQLAQRILAVENPSNRLLDQFERMEARLARQSSTLARTQRDYEAHTQQVQRLRGELPGLRQAQEQASEALEKAQAAQQRTSRALGHVGQASREASAQLTTLRRSADQVQSGLDRQGAALERARGELTGLQQAAGQADKSLAQVSTTVRQRLLRALRDAQRELAQYRNEWQQATRAIGTAVRGGDSVADPSPELSRQLAIARQSKTAYDEMQVAIQRMRTAVRGAGTDVNQLSQAHATFTAALEQVRARVTAAAAAQGANNQAMQQGAAAARNHATGQRANAAANQQNAAAARQNAEAMDALNRRGRAAMTWAQRLRGEVIALTLSYTGLYAAIQHLHGVTDAFMQIEAAQNRMLVAFNGNEALSSRELRWVREEADRLGIQVAVLAQEYSKFAIAARGSSLEGAEARRIFLAVAEAARVNKLSIDQMEGTYLALSQMMSKGVIAMEELRRQMGDRLYGAFTLAAEAMGITAAELDQLVSSGSLFSERFLPKFADRLNEVFGPQLADSLDTFTTDLGRFQNELMKAQLAVAAGGFIDGLRDALISLTEFLQSGEAQQLFAMLGDAAGTLVSILAQVPQHYQEIAFVLSLLAGRQVLASLATLNTRFRQAVQSVRPLPATLNAATAATVRYDAAGKAVNTTTAASIPLLTRLRTAVAGAGAAMATSTGRAAAMTRAVTGLRVAMAMVGGVPGLIVTGVSLALAAWVTRTRDIVDVTGQHQQQMQALLDEYSRVREVAGDWAAAVEDGLSGITLDQARKNFVDQAKALGDATEAALQASADRISSSVNMFGDMGLDDAERRVMELGEQLSAGTITAREYRKALADMLTDQRTPRRLRDLIESASELNNTMVEAEQRLLEAATVVRELGGDIDDLPDKLRESVKSLEELAHAAGMIVERTPADPLEALAKQMEELRKQVPSLSQEIRLMDNLNSIDQILDTASAIEGLDKTSGAFREFLNLAQQAKRELQDAFDMQQYQESFRLMSTAGADSTELSASLIRRREGFSEDAYWDVNAFRAGFGSDTVTLADGSVQRVVEGMKVSVADANRDLVRRIGEFQATVRQQIGEERWNELNDQQQAVLTSNAYNYGSLTADLAEAVRSGSTEGVMDALRRQATHNGGVNAERRNEEAFLFGQAGEANRQAMERFVEDQLAATKRLEEQAAEYNEQLHRNLERRAEDLEYTEGITREMAIARALADEQLRAARVGVELSKEQRDSIRDIVGLEWDRAAAEEATRKARERQAEVDARINRLHQHRRDLEESIQFHAGQGNTEAVVRLREQYDRVTESLREALRIQREFWAQIAGDPATTEALREQADAQITAIDNQERALASLGQRALVTATTVGDAFGSHVLQGFNGLFDRIRDTGDVLGSLRESFLRFASDFLLQISKMIMQQMLLNALTGLAGGGGGFWGGAVSAVSSSVKHDGGVVGPGGKRRSVHPGLFANATRYHTGGIAGLRPNEVPAVLQRGEEVLTEDDPRHRNNAAGGQPRGLSVVLVNDERDMVAAMSSSAGDEIITQYLKRNRKTVRRLIT